MASGPRLARRIDHLRPVDPLETQLRTLFATELNRGGPVATRREEEPSGVGAELLFLFESVVGVRAILAARENPALSPLDRLSGFLVGYHHPERNGLERARRTRVHRHAESIGIRQI